MPALTVENCVRHGGTNLLSKFTHGSRFRSLGFFLRNWKKREETSGRRMKDAVCQAHFNCITSLSNYRVILICNWNDDRSTVVCAQTCPWSREKWTTPLLRVNRSGPDRGNNNQSLITTNDCRWPKLSLIIEIVWRCCFLAKRK